MNSGWRRRATWILLPLTIVFLTSGASLGGGAGVKQLVVAHGVDPETLDPSNDTLVTSLSTMYNIFDPLVFRSSEGKLVPGLATSWNYLDPETLELNLRRGVKWHDGSPFGADDVVFTFDRLLRQTRPLRLSTYVGPATVAGVAKVGEYAVRIKTKGPWASLLSQLPNVLIVPREAVTRLGEERFGSSPVGTGPYKFARWDRNQQIVLDANPGYWRGSPKIGRLVVRPIPEEFSRFAALATGAADIVTNLSPDRIPLVRRNIALKVATVRGGLTIFVGMNTKKEPFTDKRVRQAMNYAVNVQELIQTVLGDAGIQNPSPCAGTDFGYDSTLKPYPYDPEKAKQLLREAGYPSGFRVTLSGPNGRYPKDREVQLAIAGQLAKVGVQVEHFTPEWAEYFGRWLRAEYQMYLLGAGSSLALDCDRTMGNHFDSKRRGLYFNSPKTDQLIWAQAAEVDPQKRLRIFAELQRAIIDEAPWIFLYDPIFVYGVRARVQWQPRSDEIIWVYDIDVRD